MSAFFVISVHWSLKIPQSIWNSFEATKLGLCIMLKVLICTTIKLWKPIQNCMLELKSSSHCQNPEIIRNIGKLL